MSNQEKKITEELKEKIKELESPNIAVLGRTGTGKSTLIKKIFGIEDEQDGAPQTGSGLPITQDLVISL
ncbi:ATP-binding cassette domain-containing protein [Scytonema sp. UIC 10036]|uniref:ATP-binding cassette domain-containing protein n=1 Tax=Scytonema sp. UIC 10036 TaxID=2304196 RepID=UPI0012DA6DEA|nr:ATP-binding cassette domain-containing protein [Scytonema sp. UIC 10036]MUG94097.1 ATP-binding cassette domain-containing protein [Scytonema sp. UIC 10036]